MASGGAAAVFAFLPASRVWKSRSQAACERSFTMRWLFIDVGVDLASSQIALTFSSLS
jgi:hypothetical protein